jgi:hypothetical protein
MWGEGWWVYLAGGGLLALIGAWIGGWGAGLALVGTFFAFVAGLLYSRRLAASGRAVHAPSDEV